MANPDLAPWDVQETIIASAHAMAPGPETAGPQLYAGAIEATHELDAWRRGFLRLMDKDDGLLLDDAAQSFLLWQVPGALNRIWDQPQTPRVADDEAPLCVNPEWFKAEPTEEEADRFWEEALRAYYNDGCARAMGRFIDAPAALEMAASGAFEDRFARFEDDAEIERAIALEPFEVVRAADLMRAEGRYAGSEATGGAFAIEVRAPFDRLSVRRDNPPDGEYEEWFEFVMPGRYRHHARLDGEDYSQGPVDLQAGAAGLSIRNLIHQENAVYRRQ